MKKLKVICLIDSDNLNSKLKDVLEGEKSRIIKINPEEISVEFSSSKRIPEANFFDVIILAVCEDDKKKVISSIENISETKEKNPDSQLIVICEVNPAEYLSLTPVISKTHSYFFGTVGELAQRISGMLYLRRKKL